MKLTTDINLPLSRKRKKEHTPHKFIKTTILQKRKSLLKLQASLDLFNDQRRRREHQTRATIEKRYENL